jgi:hypothetical protein
MASEKMCLTAKNKLTLNRGLLLHQKKSFNTEYNDDNAEMFFVSYLTAFSYFPMKQKFQKLQDMVRTGQKLTFLKGV